MTSKKTKKKTSAKTNNNKIVALCDGKRVIVFSAAKEKVVAKELWEGVVDTTPEQYIEENFDRYETSGNENSICIEFYVYRS